MKSKIQLSFSLFAAAFVFSGCTVKETEIRTVRTNGIFSTLPGNGINVAPASELQCASGGQVYTVYLDGNSNGAFDSLESVVSTQTVCNGANGSNGSDGTNGSNGHSTLFSLTRVTISESACASLSGLQVNSGLDVDDSTVLEASEITSTQVLCDGARGADGSPGASGSAGAAGSDGYNAVFESSTASLVQCSAGGTIIVMALDTDRSGTLTPGDSNQQTITLCNGVDGEDGTDGEDGSDAPATAYSPVEPILPCGKTVPYKEVLLRLQNGEVLASFSQNVSGLNTRLVLIPDGNYIDTDGSGCRFSLSTSVDGNTRMISWFGIVQKSWPMIR